MKVEIAGKERKLEVRLGNIRRLDVLFEDEIQEMAGLKVGMGAFVAINYIEIGDVDKLSRVIKVLLPKEVKQDEIDDFIYDYAEENGIGKLIQGVKELLGKSPLLRDTFQNLEKKAEKEEEKK